MTETSNQRIKTLSLTALLHIGLIGSIFYTPIAMANNQQSLVSAFKYYKDGTYIKALADLDKIKTDRDRKILGNKEYLKGIIFNRLLRYEEAIDSFIKAQKLGFKIEDFHYELGQAYYANNDLFKARSSFTKSFDSGFNKKISLYYMAHITQILEDFKKAKAYYTSLLKVAEEEKDRKMSQIAHFQLSECLLSMAEKREDPKPLIIKFVIPHLKESKEVLPESSLAKEIKTRISEVERRYYLDPNMMKNGRNLSDKRFRARFRHEVRYDSNITLSTDVPTAQSTEKETFIHETNLNMGYLFSHSGRFTHTPEIRIRNTYHTDRDEATVFQNDTFNLTGSLDNSYEHTLFGQQASALFNINYSYIERDREKIKDKILFSRATSVYFGERFRFFSFGPTTIKLKYKDYKSFDASLHNKTSSISFEQIKSLASGNLLLILGQYDYIDRYNSPDSTTANYLLRFDYLTPNIWNRFTLNTSLSTSFLDTKEQSNTRGLEKTITPSVELRRKVGKLISANLGFDYTWNISKDKQNYDYKKHVIRFELSMNY